MNNACFDFFQPVRFSTDIDDSFDLYGSSMEQPIGLVAAGLSLRVRAFCAEMELVFAQDFAVCLRVRHLDYRGNPPS